MHCVFIVLLRLLGSMPPAMAQLRVGVGIGVPSLSIGINLPAYPELARIPVRYYRAPP